MGSVAVGKEHSDRYFVLFRTTLVMLSVSPRMSAFIYEVSVPILLLRTPTVIITTAFCCCRCCWLCCWLCWW